MTRRLRTWWFHVKRRFRAWRGGGTIDVRLQVAEPTYARYERACLACGLDPEKFRKGDQDLSDAEIPEGQKLEDLLGAACDNPEAIDLASLDPPEAEALVAHVMTRFFIGALRRFSEAQRAQISMLSGAELAPLSRTGPKRRSGVA